CEILFLLRSTNSIFSTFLITGMLELEALHIWITVPFCSVVGNVIIKMVGIQQTNVPMYLFLDMPAASNLALSLFTISLMLRTFSMDASMLIFLAFFPFLPLSVPPSLSSFLSVQTC
ncbi:O52M1 protein, partial [Crocuta crocuta]